MKMQSNCWFKPILAVSFFLGFSANLCRSQEVKPHAEISSVIERFVEANEISGAVTLVASPSEVLHLQGVGKGDIESGREMGVDSIFWIASMTKPITGASVMMLVDEGKLSLDDPITKFLPGMKDLKDASGKPAVITIKHLLTHSSGMAELASGEAYTSKTLEEAEGRYRKVAVLFEPGSKWQYSQTSINTAARIVEVVSGKPFDLFVQERLFGPLGMKDTTFYLSADQMKRLATSYNKTEQGKLVPESIKLLAGHAPTDRDRFPAANGGLFSTAGDYAKFCQLLLNEGEYQGKRILSKKAVETLRTVAFPSHVTGFTPGNGWGIGCCVIREPQGASEALSPGSFGHGGAYGTQAWIDPVKKRAYVLMVQRANFPNADASEVRKEFQGAAAKLFAK